MFKKSLYSAILLLLVVFLTGCQSAADEQSVQTDDEITEVGEMVPFSRGPTSPPGIKGPSADPGALNDVPVVEIKLGDDTQTDAAKTPESVTEVEEVTYTLPKEGE